MIALASAPATEFENSHSFRLWKCFYNRKAWLFSDTQAGANASAIIYSLVETAKACGLEPYTWLRRVLRDLPAAKTVEAVEALLPWNLNDIPMANNGALRSEMPTSEVG